MKLLRRKATSRCSPFSGGPTLLARGTLLFRLLKALGELVDLLAKSIGRESLSQFSRVETVPSDNRTVKFILDSIPVDDGERRIQSTDLFDLQIEEAIILRAKRPNQKRPARNALHPAGSSRRRG
jgi:hypothetical protein